MQRSPINPWPWSLKVGYNQAEIIENSKRQLNIAGQAAVDEHGQAQHEGDMRNQIELALDNLEAVLEAANMSLSNITRLGVYCTDVDAALQNFDILGLRFGRAKVSPPMTLVGVTRLAMPSLLFEIEATAAD